MSSALNIEVVINYDVRSISVTQHSLECKLLYALVPSDSTGEVSETQARVIAIVLGSFLGLVALSAAIATLGALASGNFIGALVGLGLTFGSFFLLVLIFTPAS